MLFFIAFQRHPGSRIWSEPASLSISLKKVSPRKCLHLFLNIEKYTSEILWAQFQTNCNKANITIKQVTRMFWFPMHIKLTCALYYSLLTVVTVSRYLVSNSLQHARFLCPSLSPGILSNSYPLSQWCYLTTSSSAPLLLLPSIFPASGSFLISQLFESGGQSIGTSASSSVPPMHAQGWFPLGLTSLIFLQSKGLSKVFSSTPVWKHQFFSTQPFLWSKFRIRIWLLDKP